MQDARDELLDERINNIARNGNDGIAYSTPDEDEAWNAMQARQPAYDPDDVAFVRAGEGQKHDTEKPAMHLIPANIELEVARVMQFGAEKYGPDNWRSVPDLRNRYMSAAMRHINAMRQGFVIDDESNCHHAAHAICCLMFIGETDLEE